MQVQINDTTRRRVPSPWANGTATKGERPMGYKQRERKRKKKAASKMAQARSRESGSSTSRHSLTPVTQKAACNECGGILCPGRQCVYRHTPREILCVPCAEQQHLSYRPSLRWEQQRKRAA